MTLNNGLSVLSTLRRMTVFDGILLMQGGYVYVCMCAGKLQSLKCACMFESVYLKADICLIDHIFLYKH